MNLDIRLPIGLFFTLIGLMLTAFGLFSDAAASHPVVGFNLDATWGVCLLAFGVFFLFLARRGTSSVEPASLSPEGVATEAREHSLGLEHEDR